MPALPTLRPSSGQFGTTSNWTERWSDYIDDPISAPHDISVNTSASSTGWIHYGLTDTPLDFESMATLTIQVRYNVPGRTDDTLTLHWRITASDETTVLAGASSTLASSYSNLNINHAVGTTFTNTSILAPAYLNTTATKAQWDGAKLWFNMTYTTSMGNDGAVVNITAMDIDGTYTAGVSAIGKALDLRWGVRTAVQSLPLTLRWAVNDATPEAGYGMGYTGGYGTLPAAPVGKDLDLRWTVRAALLDSLDLRWGVRTAVSDDLNAQWALRSLVADDLDVRWAAKALAGDSLSLLWNVAELVAAAKSLTVLWDTRAAAGDSLDAQWAVRTTAADDLDVRWADRTVAGSSADLQWAVRALIGSPLDSRWAVRSAAGDTLTLRWEIEASTAGPTTPVGRSLVLKWRAFKNLEPAEPTRYFKIGPKDARVIMRGHR